MSEAESASVNPAAADTSVDGEKTVAVLLSTMRSGSTLLKALMAQAPDVCDLPETDFQKFAAAGRDPAVRAKLYGLSAEPILLLKRPGWFNEIGRYPRCPDVPKLKQIVLVRDAFANVSSLRRMVFRHLPFLVKTGFGNRFLIEKYWLGTHRRLVELAEAEPERTRLVRYEDLLARPKEITAELFAFLGSEQSEGIDSYGKPEDYDWEWGKDDGGEKIQSLQVQPPKPPRYDREPKLLAAIKASAPTQAFRRKLGYPDLP